MPFNQAGSSGSGGLVPLFDSTLGGDAASIDTGAGGITANHGCLHVYIIARTADAGASGPLNLTLNNDTGANYDMQNVNGVNVTAAAGNQLAQAQWNTIVHGSGGTANYASIWELTIPGYDQTTFFKTGILLAGISDGTAANQLATIFHVGYRSTTAISRMKIAGGTANLKAGSRLTIYGTQ